MDLDLTKMDGLLAAYPKQPDQLIQVLQDVNVAFNWLPPEALRQVAAYLGVPLARVFNVASFYRALSLKPRGKNLVRVCLGTACHVRGAQQVADEFGRVLGIQMGETTADMAFTMESVSCVGTCALGPVVVVNEHYHGRLKSSDAKSIIRQYRS